MPKPNYYCGLAALGALVQKKLDGFEPDIGMTVDLIEVPYLFEYTVDKDSWNMRAFFRGVIYDHQSGGGLLRCDIRIDRTNGQASGQCNDKVLADKLNFFFTACQQLSRLLHAEDLLPQCTDLDPEKAGIYLKENSGELKAEIVSGKDRPDLMCVTPTNEMLSMRPYADEYAVDTKTEFDAHLTLDLPAEEGFCFSRETDEDGKELNLIRIPYANDKENVLFFHFGEDEDEMDVFVSALDENEPHEEPNWKGEHRTTLHVDMQEIRPDPDFTFKCLVVSAKVASDTGAWLFKLPVPVMVMKPEDLTLSAGIAAEVFNLLLPAIVIDGVSCTAEIISGEDLLRLGGLDTEQQTGNRIEMLKKAAEGDGEFAGLSRYNLGIAYARGEDTKRDFAAAAEWMEKAAENGDEGAAEHLAFLKKIPANLESRACAGEAEAQARFSMILAEYPSEENVREALEMAKDSVAKGCPMGYAALGKLYASGAGVEKDMEKAVEYYKQGAELGDPECRYRYADYLMNGDGEKDPGGFIYWIVKAAEQGHVQASLDISRLRTKGANICPLEKAIEYLLKAAELEPDNVETAENLAAQYMHLDPPEVEKAIYWNDRAIELGSEESRSTAEMLRQYQTMAEKENKRKGLFRRKQK